MDELDTEIRLARAEDAPVILALLRRCYGSTYASTDGADAIAARIREGASVFALAETPSRRVVGQAALERRSGGGLFEYGKVVVDEEHRSRGLFARLSHVLLRERAALAGARYACGKVVTNHVHAQRGGASVGFVPTGLLLGAVPRGSFMAGHGVVEEPLSLLVTALRLEPDPRPRALALEGRDLERALAGLDAIGVPARRGAGARGGLSPRVTRDPATGVDVVRFAPAEGEPGALERIAAASRARAVWADVPVEHAAARAIVAELRELGFAHGAYLPCALDDGRDVLRLQRYQEAELDPAAIHVYEGAEAVAAEVLAEAGAGEVVAA